MTVLSGGNMIKKRKLKKKAKKTPLEKIRKELDKLEALHEKENDIVLKITDIIDEEDEENNDWGDVSYGGTDSD